MGSKNKARDEYKYNFSKSEIGRLIVAWLDLKEVDLADATFVSYISKARHIDSFFKAYPIDEIKPILIRKFRAKLQKGHHSNKNINEIFIVLRGIIKHALEEGAIGTNPIKYIENVPVRHHEPDPFSADDIERILPNCENFPNERALFQVGILTGLRISELLALSWTDIDLQAGRIHVRRAKVSGVLKKPKTSKSRRTIDLIDQAKSVLKDLYIRTGHKPAKSLWVKSEDNRKHYRESIQFVFLNSKTGRPIASESHLGKYFFKQVLDLADVRYRSIGKVRHTFASQMLTAGIPKQWIARQLGHSSTRMLDEHYGTWIRDDAPSSFLAQAEAHFDRICPSSSHNENEEVTSGCIYRSDTGVSEIPVPEPDKEDLHDYIEQMFDELRKTL